MRTKFCQIVYCPVHSLLQGADSQVFFLARHAKIRMESKVNWRNLSCRRLDENLSVWQYLKSWKKSIWKKNHKTLLFEASSATSYPKLYFFILQLCETRTEQDILKTKFSYLSCLDSSHLLKTVFWKMMLVEQNHKNMISL